MTTDAHNDVRRAELLVEAVRLALSSEAGDPDGILKSIVSPNASEASVHRHFATIIEATLLLRALRPYMPDATGCLLAVYDDALARAVLAAVMLLCYDVEIIVVDGIDAESPVAA